MKLTCDIVQDLLPLYEDGVCSPGSRAAVEEHLKTCEKCRSQHEGVQAIPEGEIVLEIPEEEKKVVGSFKKVRRRWAASLIALLLVIPVLMLTVNQVLGRGVAFTNMDDILLARRFVNALAEGNYEKAADMMDYGTHYQEVLAVQDITADNFMGNTEKVQIGEEVWYLDKTLANDLWDETDAMNIWSDLILNNHWGVMVPEEIMQAVMEREGIVQEDTANGYALSYNNIFRRLETPWGTYLVDDRAHQSFAQSRQENVDYALHFGMIPEDMYLDIQEDIEAYANEVVAANEALYSGAWEMTEEEFAAYMRQHYIADLEAVFAQGLEITDVRFYNVQRLGSGAWCVRFLVEVTYGDQRQEMMIGPDTGDGMIWRIDWSYTSVHEWQDALVQALSPSYSSYQTN